MRHFPAAYMSLPIHCGLFRRFVRNDMLIAAQIFSLYEIFRLCSIFRRFAAHADCFAPPSIAMR
jgi:hypothetical protein